MYNLFYCTGTGPVYILVTKSTGTVQPTAAGMEDGLIGYVHMKPIGSARRQLCVYLNFVDEITAWRSTLSR